MNTWWGWRVIIWQRQSSIRMVEQDVYLWHKEPYWCALHFREQVRVVPTSSSTKKQINRRRLASTEIWRCLWLLGVYLRCSRFFVDRTCFALFAWNIFKTCGLNCLPHACPLRKSVYALEKLKCSATLRWPTPSTSEGGRVFTFSLDRLPIPRRLSVTISGRVSRPTNLL